jgi:predicted DNA-binding transcriptional regulator YafY
VKLTKNQTLRRTLTDLYRALGKRALTVTYTDDQGETTVRTVELHELRTTDTGNIALTVMCRMRGAERQLLLSGISSYTIHRAAFTLTRPEPTTYERPAPAPADNADALFLYELARDRDDADYRPRVRLAA